MIKHCPFCLSPLRPSNLISYVNYSCSKHKSFPPRHSFRFSTKNTNPSSIHSYDIIFPTIISSYLQYYIGFSHTRNLTELYLIEYNSIRLVDSPIISVNLFFPPNNPFHILDRLLKLSPLS